jgi:hypothetical protein
MERKMSRQIMTMHRWIISISAILFMLPCIANAGWQVVKPSATPQEPFFQPGQVQKPAFLPSTYSGSAFPNQYATLGSPAPVYAISISGSLKENLERIMGRYHWRVIWKAPYDYNFDGKVTGSSLPNVIEKLIQPFPLQAVMYMSNRTLMVAPSTKA